MFLQKQIQIDVLKAAQIVHEEGIGFPILLGNQEIIKELKAEIGFDVDVPIFDQQNGRSRIKKTTNLRCTFGNPENEKELLFMKLKNGCVSAIILV